MHPSSALIICFAVALAASACAAIPRPEHPRPDFERQSWLNLNGEWEFEVDEAGDGEARGLTSGKRLAQRILVPFCPESKLSGIGITDFMKDVWYRRTFELPKSMTGRRILLHFGAVDWHARVWLNGTFVGEHRGGYVQFSFDISPYLRRGANELVVHAHDDTRSGLQATGKQAHSQNSEGCVYTRTTGIWQTVWLEAVGEAAIRNFSLVPDPAGKRLIFTGSVDGPLTGTTVRVTAFAGDKAVAVETVPANWRNTLAVLRLPSVRLWQPGKPYLYTLTIEVIRKGKVTDSVRSYFGMRTLAIEGNRFLINGKPVFQRLILDQGFYPDGIYTARTDEDLKRDIELSMAAGFNGARLHQKVFEPRLLYWADKLGYIVWGEYPSWGVNLADQAAVAHVANEWRQVVERDRNHPSIVGWCPLNETGPGNAVAAAQLILGLTQVMDPTRPYLDTSGYVHLDPRTDVYDCHDYDQNPDSFAARYAGFGQTGTRPYNNNLSDARSAYLGQPYFVSEYGGIRLKTDRDTGEPGWGYGQTDLTGFIERYKGLTDALLDNPNMFAFCYTQLTDVEQEQNGIYFYDRKAKYDPALLRAINARPAAYETQGPRVRSVRWRAVVPTSREIAQTWRYTIDNPGDGWYRPDFDDSSWSEAPGGFGAEGTPGSVVRTEWKSGTIWLRRTFVLSDLDFELAALDIHHDEDAQVFINGKLVANLSGYTGRYEEVEATRALREALVAGTNVMAVHCRQTTGGQYIDVGVLFGKDEKR
ncbi:MAG: beta-galactosidase [Chthonomonadales bacterium]|nr:beta-galactosidase [Chthonomonadales bacterium]